MTLPSWIALFRKDWRVYRPPVAAAVLLALFPYLAGTVPSLLFEGYDFVVSYGTAGFRPTFDLPTDRQATLALFALVGLAAAFGGMAFAAERRDGTAGFLAALPPTRAEVVASKLAVAVGCLAVAFVADAVLFEPARRSVLEPWGGTPSRFQTRYDSQTAAGGRQFVSLVIRDRPVAERVRAATLADRERVATIACTAVAAFGLAWAFSSVLPSAAVAATAAAGVVAVAGIVVAGFDAVDPLLRAMPFGPDRQMIGGSGLIDPAYRGYVWDVSAVVAGVAGVAAGAVVYARRVDP